MHEASHYLRPLEFGETADRGYPAGQDTNEVKEIPVIAGNVRWEGPTTRGFLERARRPRT